MGNPFAPASIKTRAPDRAPDHPPMLRRLLRLGLTHAERDDVLDRWAHMSDDERFEAETAYQHLDDDELRRQIDEMRAESAVEASVQLVDGPSADAAAVDPDDVPDESVRDVLAWVDGDRHRAHAALLAEQRRHDPPRKTLVEPLSDLLG